MNEPSSFRVQDVKNFREIVVDSAKDELGSPKKRTRTTRFHTSVVTDASAMFVPVRLSNRARQNWP